MIDTDSFLHFEESAREIGVEHAQNAVSWWAQDAVGGRTSSRVDVADRARKILAGLDDGDPEILDSLPSADLSGQWADGYTTSQLADDLGLDLDSDDAQDVIQDLADAYCDAFADEVQNAVGEACRSVLT